MPSTLNGFGTTYSKRLNVQEAAGVCGSCGQEARLASFDTSLALAILFIPTIRFGKKRILDMCPLCQVHKVAPHAEWRGGVDAVVEKARRTLERSDAEPREAVAALAAVIDIGDLPAFNDVRAVVEERFPKDPFVLRQLGRGFAAFDMPDKAIAALERALEHVEAGVMDDERALTATLHDDLAFVLTLMLEPARALRHVDAKLRDRNAEAIGLLTLIADAFMMTAEHTKAVDLLERIGRTFASEIAGDKALKKQIDEAMKVAQKSAKARSPTFTWRPRVARMAYPNAGKRGANVRLPKATSGRERVVGLGVAAGVAALLLGGLWLAGDQSRVHVVNGSTRVYTVDIDGEGGHFTATLKPGQRQELKIGEGEHTVTVSGAGLTTMTMPFVMETSWTQRLDSGRFFLNPDRSAVFVHETTRYYADTAKHGSGGTKDYSWDVSTGELLSRIKADYVFQAFPNKITIEGGGSSAQKTRVSIATDLDQAQAMLAERGGPERMWSHLRALLEFNPDDVAPFAHVARLPASEDMLAFFEQRLDDRPTRTEFWLAYINTARALGRDVKQTSLDRLLNVKGSPNGPAAGADACAHYVAGMILDGADAITQHELALAGTSGGTPCLYAQYTEAQGLVARGDVSAALALLDKAGPPPPSASTLQGRYRRALLGAGAGAGAGEKWLAYFGAHGGDRFDLAREQIRVARMAGKLEDADAARTAFLAGDVATPDDVENTRARGERRRILDVDLAYARRDLAALTKVVENDDDLSGGVDLESLDFELGLIAGVSMSVDASALSEWSRDRVALAAAAAFRHRAKDAPLLLEQAAARFRAEGEGELADLFTARSAPRLDDVRNAIGNALDQRAVCALLAERFPARREFREEALRLSYDDLPWLFLTSTSKQ